MRQIPILLYHSISRVSSSQFQRWVVDPALFNEHMNHLRVNGYVPLTVTQLADRLHSAYSLPERTVVITFDDGFLDFYTDAFPILQRHHMSATLYVTTGYIGQTSRWLASEGEGERPMLSWEQVRELDAAGIECGAHTRSHPQLDTISLAAARDEIRGSKQDLEQQLSKPVPSFAYPFGYHGPAVKKLPKQLGLTSACAVKHAMSAPNDDLYALSRIIISADTDLNAFGRLLAGCDLRTAPKREKWQTTCWRYARRSSSVLRRNT